MNVFQIIPFNFIMNNFFLLYYRRLCDTRCPMLTSEIQYMYCCDPIRFPLRRMVGNTDKALSIATRVCVCAHTQMACWPLYKPPRSHTRVFSVVAVFFLSFYNRHCGRYVVVKFTVRRM
jgi:hypothetical protein